MCAVIRRTCRLRPSNSITFIHAVGIDFRSRIGDYVAIAILAQQRFLYRRAASCHLSVQVLGGTVPKQRHLARLPPEHNRLSCFLTLLGELGLQLTIVG